MPDGYCEVADVRQVLQEAEFTGALGQDPTLVESAITAQSEWLREQSGRHWYDPSAGSGSLLPTETVTATEMRYDVPSSPHPQDRQQYRHDAGRYPTSTDGPYVRVGLDHHNVTTLSALRVRDASGDVTDWTTTADKVEGRGEDYYLATPTDAGKAGQTRLYVHEASLPRAVDYAGMLTLDYEYGRDEVPETIRRAVAFRAAAELVIDDEFSVSIPDNGQLVGVQTKAQQFRDRAADLLDPYMTVAVA